MEDLSFLPLRSCRLVCFPSPILFFPTDPLLKKMMGCSVGVIDIIRMALTSGRKSSAKQESPF